MKFSVIFFELTTEELLLKSLNVPLSLSSKLNFFQFAKNIVKQHLIQNLHLKVEEFGNYYEWTEYLKKSLPSFIITDCGSKLLEFRAIKIFLRFKLTIVMNVEFKGNKPFKFF